MSSIPELASTALVQTRQIEDGIRTYREPTDVGVTLRLSLLRILKQNIRTDHILPDDSNHPNSDHGLELSFFTPMCTYPTKDSSGIGFFVHTSRRIDSPVITGLIAGSSDKQILDDLENELYMNLVYSEYSPTKEFGRLITIGPQGNVFSWNFMNIIPINENLLRDLKLLVGDMDTQLSELTVPEMEDRTKQALSVVHWQRGITLGISRLRLDGLA